MADELTGENIDDIISSIEDGSISDSIDNTETADLEDTETTEEAEVTADTDDEIYADDSDTDSETEDEVDGEDTQDVEDDADESELEDDGTNGVDEVDDDELNDTGGGQSDSEDDDDIEGETEEEEVEDEDDENQDVDTDTTLDEANEFYRQAEEVEFIVNGKKVKGLGTIEDMVKARQMAGGLNDKFKAIKELRPFLAPLKERGLINNPEKFNLAMQIIDGDKEALKQFMFDSGIDPLTDEDMDMENITYEARNVLSSNEEIMYKDTLNVAKQYGVEDKFNKVVLNDWDSDSLGKFLESPETANAIGSQLSEQLQNGLYDKVMGEVAKLESTDVNGTFGAKSDLDKYNAAAQIVNARNVKMRPEPKVEEIDTTKVEKAKKKIIEKRKKAEYTEKVKERKTKADSARNKATVASKSKTKTAPAKKADPYSLQGEDLDEFVNELMDSFR